MSTLDESRDILRNSFEEFKREQEEYRQQLEEISKFKESSMGRQKGKYYFMCFLTGVCFLVENAIPLSVFMRQKRDVEGLADLRPNSSMNVTYQAYFEALLTNDQNGQHPTDRAAVVKYIRRRERRKRAEENKKNHQLSDDVLEKVFHIINNYKISSSLFYF